MPGSCPSPAAGSGRALPLASGGSEQFNLGRASGRRIDRASNRSKPRSHGGVVASLQATEDVSPRRLAGVRSSTMRQNVVPGRVLGNSSTATPIR